jgi:hypothetical protein
MKSVALMQHNGNDPLPYAQSVRIASRYYGMILIIVL